MHEIFISYSRRDVSTVRALTTALSQKGLTVWVDRSDIREGDAYDTQIEEAIAQTRVVIVLWSENSIKSHWVRAEAAYALAKHKLLPIKIDQSQPPLQFMQIQTLDHGGSTWNHNSAETRCRPELDHQNICRRDGGGRFALPREDHRK